MAKALSCIQAKAKEDLKPYSLVNIPLAEVNHEEVARQVLVCAKQAGLTKAMVVARKNPLFWRISFGQQH